ncbi:MAG: hypothetical protein PUP93_32795 [Rhizonema sp. NSF051]|nr:hypothetical protein [Rhizonema sp. NSF051]
MTLTYLFGIVGLSIFQPDEGYQMNKFAKALLLAIVFAAPVAISAPAVQAKTATSVNTANKSVKSHAGTKSSKHRKHYKHRTGSMHKSAVKPSASTSK